MLKGLEKEGLGEENYVRHCGQPFLPQAESMTALFPLLMIGEWMSPPIFLWKII